MAKKFVAIVPGVYLVGKTQTNPGVVYFRKMVNGRRTIRRATLQGALAIDSRGRATKALKAEAANWSAAMLCGLSMDAPNGGKQMTVGEWMRQYQLAASLERKRSGRPKAATVQNVLNGARQVLKAAGIADDSMVTEIDQTSIDVAVTHLISRGCRSITANVYASNLQMMAARWTENYYRNAGFEPVKIEMPTMRSMRPDRYRRPSEEELKGIKRWYEGLWSREDKRLWLAATMMLQFAMRNSDVKNATESIFERRRERTILKYTPQKTANSSGRTVAWPISQETWEKMESAIGDIRQLVEGKPERGKWSRIKREEPMLVPAYESVHKQLNEEMRNLLPGRTKASYELRKICIDHIYQRFGAEKASAISGDDIKTLSYFYADPAQAVEQSGVDINNLL